jgi:Domain of unknown function (DUF6438)
MRIPRFIAGALFLSVLTSAQTNPPTGRIKITMERRGCGLDLTCPVYKLTLDGDGSVLYEGKHRVSAMGFRRRQIQPALIRDLATRFTDMGYFDLENHLGSCEDGAVVVTSVSVGTRSNDVLDWGCRTSPSLNKLEDEIDRVANSKVWIRGRIRLWVHWPWRHS